MSLNALRALKGYPPFYLLRVTFGYGLFAHEGSNRGVCFGTFYSGKDLTLYGAKNFKKRGGLAWQRYGEHERFVATPDEIEHAAVWVGRQ